MKVLVVSGFLGAGKTTFIKEILKHTDRYVAVLENEFGEINLDSMDITASSGKDNMKVLDFSDGCVCCSKKDSFLYSVLNISSSIDPEYLIVEPSGIAKLGNIVAGLDKIRYEKIQPIYPIVIISLTNFFSNVNSYRELMENQIHNAGYVVFSKGNDVPKESIYKIQKMILDINPDIKITGQYNVDTDDEWWQQFFQQSILSTENRCHNYPDDSSGDGFENITLSGINFKSYHDAVMFCEEIIHGRYKSIVRVKGNIFKSIS